MSYFLNANFLLEHNIILTHEEIFYGFSNLFLDEKNTIILLDKNLLGDSYIPQEIIDILLLKDNELFQLKSLLKKLIHEDEMDEDILREKWILLKLFWLYSMKDSFSNVQGVIDNLYSELDYPEIMNSIVSYMPAIEQDNDKTLNEKWRDLLDNLL